MSIEADYELDGIERAHLASWITEASFQIAKKLMEDEVKKFNLSLINASDPNDIVQKHNLAKAAAQFYQGFINRLNQEVLMYRSAPKPSDPPLDPTANLELDSELNVNLEDLETITSNAPNLLER